MHLAGYQPCGNGLWDLGGFQAHNSEQYAAAAKKADRLLGYINKDITSRDKEVIISVLSDYTWSTAYCRQAGKWQDGDSLWSSFCINVFIEVFLIIFYGSS